MVLPFPHSVAIVLLSILSPAFGILSPLRVPVHGAKWYGGGGSWSAATLRVGTPSQWVNVLISTAGFETWVVGPYGCVDGHFTCEARGEIFDSALSSTWKVSGDYELGLRPEIFNDRDFSALVPDWGYGHYGQDVIRFDNETEFPNQVIATINDTTYTVGMMGLSVKSPSMNDVQYPSLTSYLYDNKKIPSRSWGYTAGAAYRAKKIPMDAVLGGRNIARYRPHDVSFELDSNQDPVATIQSITLSATGIPPWGPGPFTLLLQPIKAVIDSTTPFLWLPQVVCSQFEEALGLVWDPTTKLYLMTNTTLYNSLVQLNLTWTFTLADSPGNSATTKITVPYSAFDLTIGLPFVNSTTEVKYFPLKRATRDDQFTLGRSFLQEAYLIVDYERGNFSVSQAVFDAGPDIIVPIVHPSDVPADPTPTPTPGPGNPSGSSNGLPRIAIIGIAAGTGLLVIIVVVGAAAFFIMKKQRKKKPEDEVKTDPFVTQDTYNGPEGAGRWDRERAGFPPQELPVRGVEAELEGRSIAELPANESPANDVQRRGPETVQEV